MTTRPLSPSQRELLARETGKAEGSRGLASEYLAGRGIRPDTAERFRLGVVTDPTAELEHARGRLCIPYLGPAGNVYGIKFRSMHGEEPKYIGAHGIKARLFNTRALRKGGSQIAITEGELDAVILEQCGYAAVAVPGVDNWHEHHPRLFEGYERVVVLGDGDGPGRKFAQRVAKAILTADPVALPEGLDVTDIHLRGGEAAIKELMR